MKGASVHHEGAMPAVIRANMRAGALRHEAGIGPAWRPILHGAPSHSAAFLLDALQEDGWRLVPVEEATATAQEQKEQR